MAVIGLLILSGIAVLGVLSRKESVPVECKASKVTTPFFKMAVYLIKLLMNMEGKNGRPDRIRDLVFRKNEERFHLLEPASDQKKRTMLHVTGKLGLCLLFLCVGTVFTLLIGYRSSQERRLGADGSLQRKECGKGRYQVTLDAQVGEESFEDVTIDVAARKYTSEEITQMLPGFYAALENAFLGENESVDHVSLSLNPVGEVKGFPFGVEWSYSKRGVIRTDGRLKEDLPEEGITVFVTAAITYEDFKEDYSFPIMIYPETFTGREGLYAELMECVDRKDAESGTSGQFVLPTSVDGIEVTWTEEKKDHSMILLLLVIVMVGVIWWGKDKDLDNRLAGRDAQMTEDYPEIASKLSLYVGAGMTLRMAWKKIAEEGKVKCRYAYDEMQLAIYEMESGTGEIAAYQHFAKRARVQRYVKMVSLIEQSVKLGAKGFLEALRMESEDALEEKKNALKRKGEEAGTKLLVPMILMLAIVMVVIIVPAFMGI